MNFHNEFKNISIETMENDDVESILKIQHETSLSVWKKSDYLNEIVKTDSLCKVARTEGNEVVGFAVVRLLLGDYEKFDSAEIYNIAVTAEFQKHGIGQLLFDEVKSVLSEKDVSEIWLEVRKSNENAKRFYLKNGFIKEFERKNYYTNPTEDAFILKLNYEISN